MTDSNAPEHILKTYKTIAVVGLSANTMRPSYLSAKYLKDHGYKIIPVNPDYTQVLGEKCYPHLTSIPGPVDVVNLFRPSETVLPLVQQAIEIKAKAVWMQLDVINKDAAAKARQAGLEVVMDRCMKVEYTRLPADSVLASIEGYA